MTEERNEQRDLTDEDLEKAVGGVLKPDDRPVSVTRRGADEQIDVAQPRPGHARASSRSRQIKPF